jgi:lysozyme
MAFNLGIKKLMEFKNTLKAMSEGRYADAADGMRKSLWAKQVGKRAERLIHIMENG